MVYNEKSESAQWQEVISKQSKKKTTKAAHTSLPSVEASPNPNPCQGRLDENQSDNGHWSCKSRHTQNVASQREA